MIRTYQIIDCKYTDEIDMETFALIRDIEANVMLPVVINDYYFSHYPEHEYDVYEKIRPGDYIKGDLCIIYESIKDSTGTLFFDLYHSNIKKMRPGFEGEFKIMTVTDSGYIVLQHPTYDITITLDSDTNLNKNDLPETLHVRGELYLETIGSPWHDEAHDQRDS